MPSKAHLRKVESGLDVHDELDAALDDFLLAGSVKLFRLERARELGDDRAGQRLRHHTMMIHVEARRDGQRALQTETRRRLFDRPGRGIAIISPARTAARLRQRYLTDFHTTSDELLRSLGRLPTGALTPDWNPDWETLEPYVERAVERLVSLDRLGGVVLLVNSDEDRETPDYDRDLGGDPDAARLGRWCVVVGGLMLSAASPWRA